jgi:hypothetical protein
MEQVAYVPPAWAAPLQSPSHRHRLGLLPTPIHKWELPVTVSGLQCWIKRDDLSGMQLSGNKVRWTPLNSHCPDSLFPRNPDCRHRHPICRSGSWSFFSVTQWTGVTIQWSPSAAYRCALPCLPTLTVPRQPVLTGLDLWTFCRAITAVQQQLQPGTWGWSATSSCATQLRWLTWTRGSSGTSWWSE